MTDLFPYHQGLSKIEAMEKDLGEARLLVGQYEAKMKSLNESIKDLDGKKRSLEEQVDTLNEDVSKLKAAEQMHQVASEERQEEMQMRTALEQQISQVTTTKCNSFWRQSCTVVSPMMPRKFKP